MVRVDIGGSFVPKDAYKSELRGKVTFLCMPGEEETLVSTQCFLTLHTSSTRLSLVDE